MPCGSTGESATLTFEEHEKVISVTVDKINGKIPVLAGTGSNNTAEAVRLTKAAKDTGADGVLVISPYYNKPNRAGLIKHYTKLADLDIPGQSRTMSRDGPARTSSLTSWRNSHSTPTSWASR